DATGAAGISDSGGGAGGGNPVGRPDAVCSASAGAEAAGNEVQAGCIGERSGGAGSGAGDGSGGFLGGGVFGQYFCVVEISDVVADADGQRDVTLRGRACDAVGDGDLRGGDVHGAFADALASSGGERFRRDEADVRIFAADRFVHRDTRGSGPGGAAAAD